MYLKTSKNQNVSLGSSEKFLISSKRLNKDQKKSQEKPIKPIKSLSNKWHNVEAMKNLKQLEQKTGKKVYLTLELFSEASWPFKFN